MDWIEIRWAGPYPIDSAPSMKPAGDFGIYAICGVGRRPAYIGRTYWQTFGKRIRQHKREWLAKVKGQKRVYFGAVTLPKGKKISYERVADIEQFLISECVPPYNTVSKKGYSGRDLLVINTGKLAALPRLQSNNEDLIALIRRVSRKS